MYDETDDEAKQETPAGAQHSPVMTRVVALAVIAISAFLFLAPYINNASG